MKKIIIRSLWVLLALGVLAASVGFVAIENGWVGYMPPIEDLQNPINRFATQVYSADGKVLGTWNYNRENRIMVDYNQLSPTLVQALVATEDVRFYEHSGIDFFALGRAIVKRGIFGQKSAGGGSTITQQLAKQLYSEKAHSVMERLLQKPIEWVIAVKLERNYTKDEILTMYLNYFDFLHNAVGIKTASNTYFSKDPKDLKTTEAAVLVGLCKNPSYFNPVRHPERSLERRNVVLSQMEKAGYITEVERDSMSTLPLGLKFHVSDHKDGIAQYFRDFLRRYMMAKRPEKSDYFEWNMVKYYVDSLNWETDPLYGWCNKNRKKDGESYNVYTDGLKVYTTIDSRMQEYAEKAVYEHVAKFLQPAFAKEKKGRKTAPFSGSLSMEQVNSIMMRSVRQCDRYRAMKASGASEDEIMQAFRTKRGHVKAYVGGMDFSHFAYDMAMEGRRQVGSTIKPFLYSLAMENGFSPCDEAPNVQQTYMVAGKPWTPRNGSKARYGDMVTLKWGLQQSNNWISAYLMSKLNPQAFVTLLHEYGIRNPEIHPSMSLCLGPCDITVGEMVSAYTAFVNHGIRAAHMFVTRIEDNEGNVVAQFQPRMNEVISEQSAHKMLYMLRAVVDGGTGGRLRFRYGLKAQIGGKTGTTNNNSDAWFMGLTPRLVSGVWVGGDDRDIHFDSMAMGQGATMALPIFAYYMQSIYKDQTLGYSEDDVFDVPKDFNPCPSEGTIVDGEEGESLEDIFE